MLFFQSDDVGWIRPVVGGRSSPLSRSPFLLSFHGLREAGLGGCRHSSNGGWNGIYNDRVEKLSATVAFNDYTRRTHIPPVPSMGQQGVVPPFYVDSVNQFYGVLQCTCSCSSKAQAR